MNPFSWVSPDTIRSATSMANTTVADAMCGATGSAVAVVKAGGIDVLDLMKENLLEPNQLVSLSNIPSLGLVVEDVDGSVHIGAMVTLARLADHPLLCQRYPALSDAIGSSASPQIRAVATLGGNLLQRPRCWYFRSEEFHCLRKGGGHCYALHGENQYHAIFDNKLCAMVHPSTAATVLVALGAQLELTEPDGSRRRVLVEDFLLPPQADVQHENTLRPGEILTTIVLPPLPEGVHMAHLKQGEKESFDWPLADVAVRLDLSPTGVCLDAGIVLGAAAPVPHRARAAELVLVGHAPTPALAEKAALAALRDATPLAHNVYKLPLFETLIRRAIQKALATC